MNKKALYVLAIILTIVVGTFVYVWVCCPCLANGVNTDKASVSTADSLAVVQSDNASNIPDSVLASEEKIVEELMTTPLTIFFGSEASSVKFSDDDNAKIKTIQLFLTKKPDAKITVTGYSDSSGSLNNNNKLALKRAEYVGDALLSLGIDAAQINVLSKGIENPIADNSTSEGRAKNRRVELSIK